MKDDVAESLGVDALAVNVGQAHLHGRGETRLDLARLEQLCQAIEIPLVLHGATSVNRADLARAVQLMGPGRERGLVWNDGQCANEMNGRWYISRELETRNGQLHVSICKFDDGFEKTLRLSRR